MDHMLKRQLMALIFPVRCPVCGEVIFPHEGFCGECSDSLPRYNGIFKIKGAEQFAAPFEYTDKISPAVILMKKGIGGNAFFAFGTALAECLKNCHISEYVDIIIPVPMHKADLKKRGYNQAELIAKEVGRILRLETICGCVVKRRITENQKLLTKKERSQNLRDAFGITDLSKISGKRVLLIDDVCTTGSTLAEITQLLLKNGAAKVYCGCCCKTPWVKEEDNNDRSC